MSPSTPELGGSSTDPSIFTIENRGRRMDGCYLTFLIGFWLIWTPLTALCTCLAIIDFELFWLVWLPLAYVGVVGIPCSLLQSRKPQTFEANDAFLLVRQTGNLFKPVANIPRGRPLTLHFGHHDDESVPTLNLFTGTIPWTGRIMISALAHPSEKRQNFHQVASFLDAQGFIFELIDDHPKSRPTAL